MEKFEFYLSNTKLRDWETMCPKEWKLRHIDKAVEYDKSTEPMEWGSYFETLAIGSGAQGRVTEATAKMKASDYHDRAVEQAKRCRGFLRAYGGKVVGRQLYLRAIIINADGQEIPIEGTLDILYRLVDGKLVLIDLKFTADTESTYGKFAWGDPESMDLSQIIHYLLLVKENYNEGYPDTEYWVFDKAPDMKAAILKPEVSDYAIEKHIARISRVYNEIMQCIALDDWPPIRNYNICKDCKNKCPFEVIIPQPRIFTI